MIDVTDLSKEVMRTVRVVFESNGMKVPKGGEDMALAVSALARVAFAIASAGDPKLEAIVIHRQDGKVIVGIASDGKQMDAP